MPSPACEQAIIDAQRVGRALLKFISPNEVGLTGGHQRGYYLPKDERVWPSFTPHAPSKGTKHDHRVAVVWQNGRTTKSTVKWYGQKTRNEYRLTGFGRDFPFLTPECVGNLLVLIPERLDRFLAYVLDLEDDIEDLQSAVGAEVVRSWAYYDAKAGPVSETEDECLDKRFRKFTSAVTNFPTTSLLAQEARAALLSCMKAFTSSPTDAQLLQCVDAEYRLFRMVERKVSEKDIVRLFKSVDDFLETAQSILQRRKARAGRSLENHVEYLLQRAKIPHEIRIDVDGTKPDILIPGKKEYLDHHFPTNKLFMIGVKRTCKDRWRQVLQEAPRIKARHILTLQQGISPNQLEEMKKARVSLVVPKSLHKDYPPKWRGSLITVDGFIEEVRKTLVV